MNDTAEIRDKVRQVIEEVVSSDSHGVNEAVDRITDAIGPFRQLAQEELERYCSTFAELAK